MKASIQSNKRGIALVVVMAVLVAVTLLVAALLQLGYLNERETVRELRATQAHWLAEAGLERAISMIKVSKPYRESLGSINPPVTSADDDLLLGGAGSYTVTISRTDIPGTEESTFDIESMGLVSNAALSATDSVRIKYTGAPGVDQGFVALGGNSTIKSSSSIRIDGDVYIAGSGTIGKNADLNGSLEDGDDAYDLPDPAIDVPYLNFEKVDRTPYQAMINTASTQPASNHTASITFNGSTIYYNGNVTINAISGSGGGAIVATGTITINNKQNLPLGARLVAGVDIVFSTQTSCAGNNELFAFSNITFNTGTEISGIGNTFMAMGGIFLAANSSTPFAGILYAEGLHPTPAPSPDNGYYSVVFSGGNLKDMRGTVIAWQGFYIGSNLGFTYDPTVFADPNPLHDYFDDFPLTRPLQWEEEPYN